jgi:putative acetyltransferase
MGEAKTMGVQVVDFEPVHAEAFRTLNEAWISKHFRLEPADHLVLDDPMGQVIGKGGRIFMALEGGEPVGCVALKAMADSGFEVAKMTVAESHRGSGLGRVLLQRCIDAGAEANAHRLYLETNAKLGPALGLYRAMGFQDLPPSDTPYDRCDVFMERRY